MTAPAPPAGIRPRILLPHSRASVPLEDEVRDLLAARRRGVVLLVGPPGSGKSFALRHLAACLPADAPVHLIDGSREHDALDPSSELVLFATRVVGDLPHLAQWRMAPWGLDEWIEYLLAAHRSACASVMSRLRESSATREIGELPGHWRPVLDEMAADPALTDPRVALLRALERVLPPDALEPMRRLSLAMLGYVHRDEDALDMEELVPLLRELGVDYPGLSVCMDISQDRSGEGISRRLLKLCHSAGSDLVPPWFLLLHRAVQAQLALPRIMRELDGFDQVPTTFGFGMPRVLVDALVAPLKSRPALLAKLGDVAAGLRTGPQGIAAHLVHAAGESWVPLPGKAHYPRVKLRGIDWRGADLAKAHLAGADLSRARMMGANLEAADLAGAQLIGARLDRACLVEAHLAQARLARARLVEIRADRADLSASSLDGADLTCARLPGCRLVGADLWGACLNHADLSEADLSGIDVRGADFSGATLRKAVLRDVDLRSGVWKGADFQEAELYAANLECLDLTGADFSDAVLTSATLTRTCAPGIRMTRARLQYARLGDIQWEGVDLRYADLTAATFHMGSSRSGLVFSPFACEGSRTGYYAEAELDFSLNRPEEIRKANLRGADLRGAVLRHVDLHLVDLRGARLDNEGRAHALACGAILDR